MTFWDRIAGVYDLAERTNRRANAETVRQVRELVPQWSSVLDCAAGTGEFSLADDHVVTILAQGMEHIAE